MSVVWQHCNEVVHGKDQQEATIIKLRHIRQQAKVVIRESPALGASDRHLLQLNNIDEKRGKYLYHWLHAVRAASRKENLQR